MKITSAEFIKSAFDRTHWVEGDLPEIAFLGRSNVGKSSLINSLLARKGLARTSNTPGRTQSINYFLINEAFYFADLPGYGYARVSKSLREEWRGLAEDYLSQSDAPALCIQLVDARHPPTKLDLQLFEWLEHFAKPSLVAATKSDKLSKTDLAKSLKVIRNAMQGTEVIGYSAVTGQGKEQVWGSISSRL